MRLRTLLALLGFVLLMHSCSKDSLDTQPKPDRGPEPMSKAEMDQIIQKHLEEQNTPYRWETANARMLWSASVRSRFHHGTGL